MPIQIKLLIGVLLLTLAFGAGFYSKATIDKVEKQEHELAVADLSAKLTAALANVRVEYVTKTKTIKQKGDTIIVKVPEWVDPKIMLNKGFILHHNAAADNSELGEPPADVLSLSDVSLSDAEAVIASNYTTANACRQQVISLQESIKLYQEKTKPTAPTSKPSLF